MEMLAADRLEELQMQSAAMVNERNNAIQETLDLAVQLRQTRDDRDMQTQKLQRKIDEQYVELRDLCEEAARIEKIDAATRHELDIVSKRLAEVREKCYEWESTCNNAITSICKKQLEVDEIQIKVDRLVVERDEARAEADSLRWQCDELKEQRDTAREYVQSERSHLQAVRDVLLKYKVPYFQDDDIAEWVEALGFQRDASRAEVEQLNKDYQREKDYRENLRVELRKTREILDELDKQNERTVSEKARTLVNDHKRLGEMHKELAERHGRLFANKRDESIKREPSRLEIAAMFKAAWYSSQNYDSGNNVETEWWIQQADALILAAKYSK